MKYLLLFLVAIIYSIPSLAQVSLRVAGDSVSGFHVEIYNGDHLIVTNTEEFTFEVSNRDLSTRHKLPPWNGMMWSTDDTSNTIGNSAQPDKNPTTQPDRTTNVYNTSGSPEKNFKSITLTADSYIPLLDANLSASVTYTVINDNLVKKTVELFQPSMPGMLYTLTTTARAAEPPVKYVTFEYDNFPGGFVHEIYPSAGFVTQRNEVVGFLTDAGYLNRYTRTTRRRFSGRGGGFVGMRLLPDVNLFKVADSSDRLSNDHFISQTFGEMYNLDAGSHTGVMHNHDAGSHTGVMHNHDAGSHNLDSDSQSGKKPEPVYPGEKYNLKASSQRELITPSKYNIEGNTEVTNTDGIITITGQPGGRAGIEMFPPFRDQSVYTITFLCKGTTGVALKLFQYRNGIRTTELEHGVKYIDNFPVNEDQWTEFTGSILVPYIEGDSVSMFIGSQSGKAFKLEIKDLRFIEHTPEGEPWNVLPLGEKETKTTWIFVEPWQSHREFMISSQSRLAEGKGFAGTQIEKMLFANLMMHTWVTDVRDYTPFTVPNMNYAPDMYNRDSFFAMVSTDDPVLNIQVWEQWGRTQTPKGGIGTIITPYMGSVEAKDNEATIHWLIWAMLNKRRFDASLPEDKISKAVSYVLNEFDDDRDGKCRSHFSLSQVDIVDFQPKTDRLGVNQGMLAIALRTIKELGDSLNIDFGVTEDYIQKAEAEYRNFYDPVRKHMLFDRNFPDIISFTDLEPEFFSLWLFNRPILTDEMVVNHLNRMPMLIKSPGAPHPEFGTVGPVCVRLTGKSPGWAYLSGDYQPFEQFGKENYSDGKNDGYYYNGGSWLRAEYCAYVTGLRHGWKDAIPRMENRLWAEINLRPDWPFSKEFVPTKITPTSTWWPSTRGLSWNVFIIIANDVAGF